MASTPKSSLATLRPDLGYAMMEFDLQANINGMVAQKIMPVLEVDEQAGNWGVVPIEELLKKRDTARAPGGRYNQGGGKFEPRNYACLEHGFEEPVDDRESQMYANYFDSEVIAALRARHAVLQNYELRVVAAVETVAQTASAAVDWATAASTTPMTDLITWKDSFFVQIGMWPNAFAMSKRKFEKLRNCDQIIERLKFQGFHDVIPENVNEQMVAQCFNIPELIVAGSAQNTANMGQAAIAGAATIASLWPDHYGLLFLKPRSNDMREPCWGRTFHWGEDGSSIGGMVETYRDESRRSNMVRAARMDETEVQVYTQAAILVDLGTD